MARRPAEVEFRRATDRDADAVAALFRETRLSALPYLPVLHSPREEREYFRDRVLVTCEVWVAEALGCIIGFCAFREGWVEHLYVHPVHARTGIGRTLLNKAKQSYPQLHLWVFQRNEKAKAFYAAMGFSCVKQTDGADNEEREPDALFYWSTDSRQRAFASSETHERRIWT
ncbi:MAG TPA: GNAT family N-acetyltransferase [Candidatus Cybelea sp.]